MDKDKALRDVQEIKRVMEESRKRSGSGRYWMGPVLALLALVVSGLLPFLAPVIAIGLLVGGVIARRRSNDPIMRAIAAGVVAVGIILLLITLFVILGLVPFYSSLEVREWMRPIPQLGE